MSEPLDVGPWVVTAKPAAALELGDTVMLCPKVGFHRIVGMTHHRGGGISLALLTVEHPVEVSELDVVVCGPNLNRVDGPSG